MSLRSLIGLCEHRWDDTGQLLGKRGNPWRMSVDEPAEITTSIKVTQRCRLCGKVRSVRL